MKVTELIGGEILNFHFDRESLEVHTTKGILKVTIRSISLEGRGEKIDHENDHLDLQVIELLKYTGPLGHYEITLKPNK